MAKKRKGSIYDRLLPEIKDLIAKLRRNGRTIDEIRDKLLELDVDIARSTLGYHIKRKIDDVQERMRHSRAMAEALVAQFGEEPDNRLARANLELMHSVVMNTITASEIDPETGEVKPVVFDAQQAMFLAKSLQSLASAEKQTDDRIRKAVEEARKEAANRAGKAAKEAGLTKETASQIMKYVLGDGS